MIGPLSGFLLATPDESPVRRELLTRRGSSNPPYLQFVDSFEQSRYWEQYEFLSDRTFSDEDTGRSPPLHYDVYCARSGSKLIVLTEKKRLSSYIIERVLNFNIYPNLKHVSFQIEQMITAFQASESSYRATSVYGRYSGPDQSLKTIVLYGSEVTNSALFQEQRHLFNFYRCGVAEKSHEDPFFGDDYGQIAKLGQDGSISTQSFHRQRAVELNKILNYVVTNKWVDEWAGPAAGYIDDNHEET